MATEEYRKKIALLDWQNEKKYQEKVLNNPNASLEAKAYAKARIKEAETMIKELKD